ncbi:hypothetical protein [Clostridium cellulovorans]|uniref:hypothetical protein n=1 Tax=Clostridium cellulovorans TaxID=1493 RepID=UPI0001E8ED02|nr:hypothetical protein [Clostridium cellulovorans]
MNLSELILKKYNLLKTNKDRKILSTDEITKIYGFINSSNITDPVIIQEHIKSVKRKIQKS